MQPPSHPAFADLDAFRKLALFLEPQDVLRAVRHQTPQLASRDELEEGGHSWISLVPIATKIAIELTRFICRQHKTAICYFASRNAIRRVPACAILFRVRTTRYDWSRQAPTGAQSLVWAILEPQFVWGKMWGFRDESDLRHCFRYDRERCGESPSAGCGAGSGG